MKLPIYVKNCIELLEKAGFSAYAVGGAVRDGLLGVEPSDWDVTTSARPNEILRVFENFRTIPTGIKHGTVTVLFENGAKSEPVEITTFRVDGEYRDARHPESVTFSKNIIDDLSRRDFTVNAMAYNAEDGIIDAFGGVEDLKSEIIRTVGDAKKRFSEDALRILRAFRFSAQLGFEIEEKTLEGASKCAHLLKNIARERIGVEFKKLLGSKGAAYALSKMVESGVWEAIFDISAPSLSAVEGLSLLETSDCFARLSVLIGGYGEDKINEFLSSLRLSNAEKKLVSRFISIRSFDVCGADADVLARRFIHLFRDMIELSVTMLRFYNPSCDELLASIECEQKKENPLTLSSLAVKGSDLLPLCGGDYRRVGLVLNELLSAVIDDPALNERERLMELAARALENEK